jgi:hypothetical protein
VRLFVDLYKLLLAVASATQAKRGLFRSLLREQLLELLVIVFFKQLPSFESEELRVARCFMRTRIQASASRRCGNRATLRVEMHHHSMLAAGQPSPDVLGPLAGVNPPAKRKWRR